MNDKTFGPKFIVRNPVREQFSYDKCHSAGQKQCFGRQKWHF